MAANRNSIALAFVLLPILANARVAEPRVVFGSGGGAATGGVYALADTTGESPVGPAASSSYVVSDGFWGTFGSLPAPYFLNLTVRSNVPAAIPVSRLLAGSDADGDSISLTELDSVSANGAAIQLNTGVITYPTPSGFLGSDSFHYVITDGSGDSAQGTVSLTVAYPIFTVTTAADSGPGSLRAALSLINAAADSSQNWRIRFDPSLAGRAILLSNRADNSVGPSALVLSNRVWIDASGTPGLSISLDPASAPMRLLYVAPAANVALLNLSLQGGIALATDGASGGGGGGGGAGFGGAIFNQGVVTLTNVTLSANQAFGGAGGAGMAGSPGIAGSPVGAAGFGGGANGLGTCGGGGGLGAGGGIFNDAGVVNMTNCVVDGNGAAGGSGGSGAGGCNGPSGPGYGGGLFNYNGFAFVSSCLFSNNAADTGGGLCNYGDAAASWVYLTDGLVTNRQATNDFLSLSANGGDAQSVENDVLIDSQYAVWISPVPDVGTIHSNLALTVPITINVSSGVAGTFVPEASSANESIVASSNLAFSGSGGSYTLTIQPRTNQTGIAVITVFTEGSGLSAAATFTAYFGLFGQVTVEPTGRMIYLTADPGLTCAVQYKTSLSDPAWTTLGDAVEISPGHYQFVDSGPGSFERFYRIIALGAGSLDAARRRVAGSDSTE